MNVTSFEKRMQLCDRVCQYLDQKATLGSINHKIQENFHYELMKFAVYLSDSDKLIETEEVFMIRRLLKVDAMVPSMQTLKVREHIPQGYILEIPYCIKAAASDDNKILRKTEPFYGQCTQILYDTFRAFGLFFISLHENDPTDQTAKAYTRYIQNLQDYMDLYHVLVPEEDRLFAIELSVDEQEHSNQTWGNPDIEKIKPEIDEPDIPNPGANGEPNPYGVPVTENPVSGTEYENMTLEEKLNEFHDMIGLEEVKYEVDSLINLIRIQKLREARGLKKTEVSKHMVFTGNPGTGKTTVARILASIYKDLGVLSKGTFIEVDRSGLVKGFVGQTAIQVKTVVEEARGGILFIDEAYTLAGRGDNDYGQEAIDTLLKAMEDMREELIVIVAGYPDLMEQFIDSNPGLKSRFNKYIEFIDYTVDEQLQILQKMCAKQDYTISPSVLEYVRNLLEQKMLMRDENNGNARDIRNMLESAIMKQATRIIDIADPTNDVLTALEIDDFM